MASDSSPVSSFRPGSMSLAERLLYHFYSWEHRGRGWVLYDAPVELEPPFRPFTWELPEPPRAVDDGRHHTLFSRLVEKIGTGWSRSKPEPQVSDYDEIEEPDPEIIDSPRLLIEIDIAIPASLKVTKDGWLRFIQSLRHCHDPLAFEIIGTAETISVQVVCSDSDLPQVSPQLESHFPDCLLNEQTGALQSLWSRMRRRHAVIVDFGLSQEFMVPLESISAFDPDPLTSIVGAMGRLRDDETAVFQVVFQAVQHPWAKSTLRAVTDWEGDSVFEDQNMLLLTQEKMASPLYAAVVRVAMAGADNRRSWQVVRGIGGALGQYSRGDGNELIPLTNQMYPDDEHEEDLFERRSHRCGMILNAEELASLAHLPSASVRSPKIRKQIGRTKASPEIAKGHSFVLGENTHQRKTTQVSLSPEQRSRHMHVIGASGTGKSTFLLQMIRQDMKEGNGFAVLDPHGDLIDQIIGYAPQERLDDIILVDPSDYEYSVGLNILTAHSEIEKTLLSSDLVSAFQRLSTSWGDQMTSVLSNAILAFLESSEGGTLRDLRRFLVDKNFRNAFLRTVQEPELVYYWRKEFPQLSGKPHASILTRLNAFFSLKPIRDMMAQKESKLDFRSIMDSGKILLARLSQGAIGEKNAYLLGSFLVSKFQQTAMSRQDLRESDRRPFYLYIDECHNFVTPSMNAILSGTRKYKLGLILAHQELHQLGGSDLASAVLTHPFTRVCFRVDDQDARKLDDGFSTFESSDLRNLGVGEAIARIERADNDFNLSVPSLPPLNEDRVQWNHEYVTTRTHNLYCRSRAEIAREIAKEYEDESGGAFEEEFDPKPRRRKKAAEPEPEAAAPQPDSVEPEPARETRPPEPPSRPVPPPAVAPVEPPVYVPKPPSSPGRGGPEHKRLQELIKLEGEELGFRVSIERKLDAGGSADVVLELGKRSIACEITVTSTTEYELGKLRKYLETEKYDEVFLIVAEAKRLSTLKRRLEETFSAAELERIDCLTVPDLIFYLKEEAAASKAQAGTVRGYDVARKHKAVSEQDKQERQRVVAEIIAKTMAQRKQKKRGAD
ncbi:MAG: hypothetical protein GHCLOJNM_03294 [bacterium]|nr:hypothetical protein [bacterium]